MVVKKRRIWLCAGALLFAVVLLGGGLLLWRRGDIRYAVECALRVYPAPAMQEIEVLTGRVWDLRELETVSGVKRADTLLLIRDDHPLPSAFEPQVAELDGAQMHPDLIPAYLALREAVEAETGRRLYITDDYRTREEQEAILAEQGTQTAASAGCSEHEAALALDVCVKGYGGRAFLKTDAGRMVNRQCGAYGFVIRYGQGKQDITGIAYEPWHLRYVGQPHARVMMESDLSLEEYLGLLTYEQWFAVDEYRILVTEQQKVLLPDGWVECVLSDDNRGHTVITLKMG